jgi:hypothetical protein
MTAKEVESRLAQVQDPFWVILDTGEQVQCAKRISVAGIVLNAIRPNGLTATFRLATIKEISQDPVTP